MPSAHIPIPPVINGLRGSYPQLNSYGRNSQGYYWDYNFEGTAAEVDADAAIFNLQGAEFEVEELRGGRKKLHARVTALFPGGGGDDEQPENVWELDPNEVEKDLLEADFPFGTLGTISAHNRSAIAYAIANPSLYEDAEPPFTGGNISGAISLYTLMKNGVRSFPVDASVIRHTQLVSNRYTVQASATNAGRILSTSSMYSLEGVPSEILFAVPTPPTVSQYIETAGDLQYGWRKVRPGVRRLSYTRWQITTVWQFGLWTVKTYGAVL